METMTSIQKEKVLKKFKSPEIIWNLDKENLREIEEIDENCIDEILNPKYRFNLEKYENYMNENDIHIINLFDELYPDKLKNIYDKPVILFAKGNLKLLRKKSIAIVGCRECSLYGKKVALELAFELAKQNICIISGLARGIDKYSHIGAIKEKESTIAVIGNGLDNIYPYENSKLAEEILKNNGLILSEYIIGTKPNKMNFPARNRIISGLSDGIVIVEAKNKSGALITADFGLEQGKEIFAVPGNIYSNNSFGTNDLIKQGANIVTCCKDIIDYIV